MGGNGVGQPSCVVDAGDRGQDLGRNLLVEFDVLVELLHHRAAQGFDLAGLGLLGLGGRHGAGHHREVVLVLFDLLDQRTLLPFDQHLDGAVGQLEHLQDGGDAAHREHVGNRRFILGCGLLGHQHDAAFGGHGGFERLDALGTPHEQGDHHVGEHHDIAQGQQRQLERVGRRGGLSGHIWASRISDDHMRAVGATSIHHSHAAWRLQAEGRNRDVGLLKEWRLATKKATEPRRASWLVQ